MYPFQIGHIVVLGDYQPAVIVGMADGAKFEDRNEQYYVCEWVDTIGVVIRFEYSDYALRANGNEPHRFGCHYHYRPQVEKGN
jgi:hypothetical protein